MESLSKVTSCKCILRQKRANMFANAAKMEKHFQPPEYILKGCFDSFHCLHFARLYTEALLFCS